MPDFRMHDSGAVVSAQEYFAMYPHTSFAVDFTPDDADRVIATPPLATTPHQRAVLDGVEQVDGQWRYAWRIEALSAAEIEAVDARITSEARMEAKARRSLAIDSIVVPVGDKLFDGDEPSQARMLRKIYDLEARGASAAPWTLADNSRVEVSLDELRSALAAAEQRQSAIWDLQLAHVA